MADTQQIPRDNTAPPDIDPRVRDLIARIEEVEPARPRLDTAMAAAAVERSLDAAGRPRRPLRWFSDSMSAHQHVWSVATAAARRAACDALTKDLDTPAWNAAMEASWDRAWRMAHLAAPKAARAVVVRIRAHDEPPYRRTQAAWLAGHAAAEHAAHHAVLDSAFRAASSAARELAHRASTAAFKAPAAGIGGEIDKAAAWATWRAAALRSGAWLAHDGAISAVAHLSALYAFDHPAQAHAAALGRPMIDAMTAGLFCYWVAPSEVICVPRPALHTAGGRLHRDDGPAVEWPTGEAYWFRHGEAAEPPPGSA